MFIWSGDICPTALNAIHALQECLPWIVSIILFSDNVGNSDRISKRWSLLRDHIKNEFFSPESYQTILISCSQSSILRFFYKISSPMDRPYQNLGPLYCSLSQFLCYWNFSKNTVSNMNHSDQVLSNYCEILKQVVIITCF